MYDHESSEDENLNNNLIDPKYMSQVVNEYEEKFENLQIQCVEKDKEYNDLLSKCKANSLNEEIIHEISSLNEFFSIELNNTNITKSPDTLADIITELLSNVKLYIEKSKLNKNKEIDIGNNTVSIHENYKEKLEQLIFELEQRKENLLSEIEILKGRIVETRINPENEDYNSMRTEGMESSSSDIHEKQYNELELVKKQVNNAREELSSLLHKKEDEIRIMSRLQEDENELKEKLKLIEATINRTEDSFKVSKKFYHRQKKPAKKRFHSINV